MSMHRLLQAAPAAARERSVAGAVLALTICAGVLWPAHALGVPLFQAPFYTVGPYGIPLVMAVADLNGVASLLTLSQYSADLHVRRGVLGPDESYPVGTSILDEVHAIATGRVNADLYTDVVLTAGNAIVVVPANPDGTFGPSASYPVSGPTDIVMANVVGDWHPEMAVLRPGVNALEIRTPDATGDPGATTTYPTGPGARSLVAADVNGDGKQDLVVVNKGDSTVSVYLGDPTTFGTRLDTSIPRNLTDVRVADVDRDGHPDLIVTVAGAPLLEVLAGNGDGTFAAPVETTLPFVATALTVGDMNGDGNPDVVVAPDGDGLALLPGHGALAYNSVGVYPHWTWPAALASSDLDGDGREEVIASCWNVPRGDYYNESFNSFVAVIPSMPGGRFREPTEVPVGPLPGVLAAGDLNGDEHPDVAVTNNSQMTLLMATGPGRFERTDVNLDAGQTWVAIADLDHTGPLDLIASIGSQDKLAVMLGRNGDLPERMPDVPTGDGPVSIAILDANGDGNNDVAVATFDVPGIEIHFGNGDGTFGGAMTTPVSANYNSGVFVSAGEFDGDDNADLLVAKSGVSGPSFSSVEVWHGNGDGTFAVESYANDYELVTWAGLVTLGGERSVVYAGPREYGTLYHSDMDRVSVLWGNGSGEISHRSDIPGGLGPLLGAVGDLDGDGDDEVVISNLVNNSASVFSTQAGPFGAQGGAGIADQLELGTGPDPRGVAIADVNWDGKPDILVANRGSNTISILYNLETGLGVEPATPASPLSLLDGIRPNPARGQVSMMLTLPRAGHARVRVYDGAGRLVRTLLDADLAVGSHPVVWDGRSDGGAAAAPGIYYFAARVGTDRATKRVVLLR